MRIAIQIWMFLALLLAERIIAKTGGDLVYIDESSGVGDNEGDNEPDGVDFTNTVGELGSGTPTQDTEIRSPTSKPAFENTIRVMKIGEMKATFNDKHNDINSAESQEVFQKVCNVVTYLLQQNEVTSSTESCVGVSIAPGSLVVKTKLEFAEGSSVTSSDIQGTLQDAQQGRILTDGTTSFSADPTSILVAPVETDPSTNNNPMSTFGMPTKPNKPKVMTTTMRPNKGNQDNDIFIEATPSTNVDQGTIANATMSNEIPKGGGSEDTSHNNDLQVMDKDDNFFEMILGNPFLLAALVGAVVLTLLTIILVMMFLIYRVKKKDEGSYSLDEPHKVKDPTTYWKDTKEFYA